MSLTDAVVIGGGIAGLATAYELRSRGRSVRLLESRARAGGVMVTERAGGWVIDGGPDSLLVQKPAALALCRELGLDGQLAGTLPPRTAYVLRAGRLHALPEGSFLGFPLTARALAASSLFSLAGKARVAVEVVLPAGDGGEDESVASFVRRRFGQEAVDYLAEPLLAGIHAGDVDRLSVRALFPRLREAERTAGSVIRSFRRLHTTPSTRGAFVSFPGGIAVLADAVADALGSPVVTTNAPVRAVRVNGHFIVESDAGQVEARAVVFATPAYVTSALVRPLDATLASLCEAIPYASTATVAFGFRREQVAHPLHGTGFVVPRAEGRALLAGTWVSSKWPGRAPDGHVLIRGFFGGGRDPNRLRADDQTLVATALAEFGPLLGIAGDPLFSRVFRWTRQSPQYEVGHLDRVARIERRLAALPGLFVTGSGFRAVGIPDCIADGRDVARCVADFLDTRPT